MDLWIVFIGGILRRNICCNGWLVYLWVLWVVGYVSGDDGK